MLGLLLTPFNLLKFKDMVRVNVSCFAHKALYHALPTTLTDISTVLIEFIAVAPDMQIIFIPSEQVLVTFIVSVRTRVISVEIPLPSIFNGCGLSPPPNLRKNSAEGNEK